MEENIDKVYLQSSELLDTIKGEYEAVVEPEEKREFYFLKYMAIIISNDLSREYYNVNKNPSLGVSKLLALGPLILKLFEAHLWYQKKGNPKIRTLAEKRGLLHDVETRLKQMKSLQPAVIESYSKYRNRLAGHYDSDCIDLIQEFGTIEKDKFFDDVSIVLLYGIEWIKVLKYIAENPNK